MSTATATRAFSISRYTIRDTEDADKPRSRRALNASRALGAILNKPQWWIKWTTRPDVRIKWLREIAEQLIRLNVSQTIRGWPSKREGEHELLYPFIKVTNSAPERKERLIARFLEHVQYPRQCGDEACGLGVAYESDDEMAEFARADIGADMEDDESEDDESSSTRMAKRPRLPGSQSVGDEDDSEDESELHFDYEVYQLHKQSLNSFCEIGWYVTMAIAREKLQVLPLANWTEPVVTALVGIHENEDEQISRTTDLMLAVVFDPRPISLDLLREHLPHETRDNVLKLLRLHFQCVVAFLYATRKNIETVLDLIIRRSHLTEEILGQHNTPGTVPQTWLSDDAIPIELKRKFVAEVASLENIPHEQKDWHPDSDDQVLNLVHPSLFCGRINQDLARGTGFRRGPTPFVSAPDTHETRIVSEIALTGSAAEHMNSILFAPTTDILKGPTSTQFQWLPSEFDIAEDGSSVNIRTYINNLHPEIHASMYDSIASIFSHFVPLFDQVLSSLDDSLIRKNARMEPVWERRYNGVPLPVHPADAKLVKNLRRELGTRPTSSLRRLVPPGLFEIDSPRFSLKGKRCQVIIKIAEIHLTPEKPNYNGGSWHIKGTDAERIIATGLYYFGCENITESRLSFRTIVAMPDYEQDDAAGVALSYELYEDRPMIQNLGSVTAIEDRCVVFPNIYQHKVEPFSLADPTKPGVRKILAFFLVDPVNDPIPSTAIVPPQQQEWIDLAREPQLVRMGLPDVVTDRIRDMSRVGMSLDEAKRLRVELMAQRKVAVLNHDEYYILSLCEH